MPRLLALAFANLFGTTKWENIVVPIWQSLTAPLRGKTLSSRFVPRISAGTPRRIFVCSGRLLTLDQLPYARRRSPSKNLFGTNLGEHNQRLAKFSSPALLRASAHRPDAGSIDEV